MDELKAALSQRTNLEQSLADSKRATRNAENQPKATVSENERLQKSSGIIRKSNEGNEHTIAKLKAKLVSMKGREEESKVSMEELQAALLRNGKLRKNNRELQISIERNEQKIAELEAKIVSMK